MTPHFDRALYRRYASAVGRAVAAAGVAPASTDDAIQDVFVVAYQRRNDYDGRPLEPWLVGIARRVAGHYRRSAFRHARRVSAAGSARAVHCERPRERTDACIDLGPALESLEPDRRRLLHLTEIEGRSQAEAAVVLGINPNTAQSRVRAAKSQLRRRLAPKPQPMRGWLLVFMPWKWPLIPVLAAATVVGALSIGGSGVLREPATRDTSAPASIEAMAPNAPAAVTAPRTRRVHPPATLAPALEPTVVPPAPLPAPTERQRRASATKSSGQGAALLSSALRAVHRGDDRAAIRQLELHERRFPTSALATSRNEIRKLAEAITRSDPSGQ